MAEKVEEIAELLEVLKKDNETNAEAFNKLLADIRLKLENLNADNTEFSSIINDLNNILNSKISEEEEKLVDFNERLKSLEGFLSNSLQNSDTTGLKSEIELLASNFKEAVESIVDFANKDSESKNILFDKISSLEAAAENTEDLSVFKEKISDISAAFEHFITDANLRNANIISAIMDLKRVMDENSSKNAYLIEPLNNSVTAGSEKISDLENTVTSQFAGVNSKLFSLGDDIQKTLNDGFEYLKYLSSNLSESMNSNSIDMKTSLECIRANLSDYCENLNSGLENFNTEFGAKVAANIETQTKDTELILGNLNSLGSRFEAQAKEYETSLSGGLAKIYEFISAYKDAIQGLGNENKEALSAEFSAFEVSLNKSYGEYRNIVEDIRVRIEDSITLVRETADSVVLGVVNSNSETVSKLKNDLLISSEHNLESIIEKIDETSREITGFKNSIADNLSEYLSSVKDLFVNYSDTMASSLKSDEILEKLTKVESLIENNNDTEKTITHLESVICEHSSEKNEKIDSLRAVLEDYKKSVDKLTEDFAVQNGNTTFDLSVLKKFTHEVLPKFNNLKKLDEILSKNSSEFREALATEVEDIKSSISEIAKTVSELPVNDNTEVIKKFLDFEVQLSEASQTYETNLESLKLCLNQYAENTDKITEETDIRLQETISEVRAVQAKFDTLAGKMSTLIGDSGLIEILANIRQQFNTVLAQLKNEREGLTAELSENLNEGINSVSSNLYLIGQNIEEVRVKQSENAEYLRGNFEEKMLGLQADIEHTISDIKNVIEAKSEAIVEAFNPLKNSLTTFTEFDYEQIISDIKNQIEMSYVNMSETLDTLIDQNVSFELVDGLFKEAIFKLTNFEQHVQEMSESNFELIKHDLLNITTLLQGTTTISENIQGLLETDLKRIENNILETKETVKKSLVEQLESIKSYIAEAKTADTTELRDAFLPLLDNEKVLDVIRGLNKNLVDKIEEFKQDDTLASQDILDIINSVNNTVDYTLEVINDKFGTVTSSQQDMLNKLDALNSKIDVLAMDDNTDIIEAIQELKDGIAFQGYSENNSKKLEDLVLGINSKLDVIVQSDDIELQADVEAIKESLASIENRVEKADVKDLINTIDNKLDVIAQNDNIEIVEGLEQVTQNINTLQSDIQTATVSNSKLEDLINTLHNKVDVIAMADDSVVQDEISEIKNLIVEQISNDNSNDVNNSLQNLLTKITEIDLSKQTGDIKEAVVSALVTLTNDISFVEETEEIKDFVSERTNELHRTMMDVKHQLSTITNAGDDMDFYSYTLQDVESDIAKLRLILKDMSGEYSANELCVMSANILKISKTLESLREEFNEAEERRLNNFDLNEQVVSISARLNQLLINKKEIDDIVLANLTDTTNKLNNIDTSDVAKGIEKVLLSMDEKLEYSNNLNTILKNVMMYLGEWMDGTTETISSIYDKTAKISSISSAVEELKKAIPDKSELLNALEMKFKEQDSKISRLEDQLNRISGMISTKNDSDIADRIDRIDNKLEKLSENIEKLASYVE